MERLTHWNNFSNEVHNVKCTNILSIKTRTVTKRSWTAFCTSCVLTPRRNQLHFLYEHFSDDFEVSLQKLFVIPKTFSHFSKNWMVDYRKQEKWFGAKIKFMEISKAQSKKAGRWSTKALSTKYPFHISKYFFGIVSEMVHYNIKDSL